MSRLSRRTFLAAGAGAVLAAACGNDDSTGSATTTVAAGGATGDTVLVRFFNDGVQAAGLPQRLPFGLGTADGVVVTGGPEQLDFEIVDGTGQVLHQASASRHADGVPRPYWPLELNLATAGIYTANVRVDGKLASAAFTISEPSAVPIPKPGDPMIPVATPTTADARGVTPICTRTPACPLHTVTLTEALATSRPVALLIGTPAYCQTGVCGPVLDILLAQQASYPEVLMVHAEVYVDPQQALSSGSTTAQGADLGSATEAVLAYGLTFEPVLFLASSDGTIATRFDNIWDGAELSAALANLS